MATASSLMPFLRPMGLPRPSTVRHFLRFSTAPTCRGAERSQAERSKAEDPNLVASRTASPAYPPRTMPSPLRPKDPRGSQRSSPPKPQRPYPTRGNEYDQPVVAPLIPAAVKPLAAELCAPNLPYFVRRTSSNELPIYHLRKRGGTKLLTLVRKVDGSVEALRDELRMSFAMDEAGVTINPVTKHVVLKGHLKPKIQQFLWERLF